MIHIAVEGCVGVGKSTVATKLAEYKSAHLVLERFDLNPFLEKFYCNPQLYSLETEFSFVLIHYHQLCEAFRQAHKIIISDFTLSKDMLFAEMNLSKDEMELFAHMHEFLTAKVGPPTLVVCLEGSNELILERIEKRRRHGELSVDPEYFRKLNTAYSDFFRHLDVDRIMVSMNEMDFEQKPENVSWLATRISERLSLKENQ